MVRAVIPNSAASSDMVRFFGVFFPLDLPAMAALLFQS
jgi:hypothetical protein